VPWLQSSQHHPHNSHGKHDEVALLRLNTAIKPHSYLRVSWRFESIYKLAWGKLDNTTHVSHKDHMSGHSLRWLPNSGPYAIPRRAFMVGPHTILCASCRYVGYHPTRRPAKLLSLWNPINPICASTKSMVVPQGSTDAVPNRHRQGLPPSKLRIWKHMTLTFPSSILHFPLIAPPGLILWHNPKVKDINHIEPPSIKGPYCERFLTTHLLPIAYTTKHSILSLSFLSLA
jgi:hypothetical protein